jgi:acyl-CoA reductase-like NAD-dependent aldehyde dehydrogenase
VADPRVGFVSFTGSVRVGREIEKVVADSNGRGQGGFKGLALEVGDICFNDVEIAAHWSLAVGWERRCLC